MRAISERVFWDKYKPIETPTGDYWEYKDTLAYPMNRVWTLIEGEKNWRNLYACPGYHIVNVLGYCVTEEPWTDQARVALYFSGRE